MVIINRGNTYKTTICPHCSAELGYSEKDIYRQGYVDDYFGDKHVVERESLTCEDCGKRFDILFKIDGKEQ